MQPNCLLQEGKRKKILPIKHLLQKWFDYFLFVGSSLHAREKTRHIHLLHDVTWFSVESTLPWFREIRIQDNINIQPPFPSMIQHRLLGYSYQLIRSREQGIRMKEYLRWEGWLHIVMEGQMASAQKRTEYMYKIYNRNISSTEISLSGSPIHTAALGAVWGRITLYNLTPGCTLVHIRTEG